MAGQDDPAIDRAVSALCPGGALERAGYRHRPGQVEMARAVARAVLGRSRLLVQAPTGSGKSFAYLVPALALTAEKERVVVATANLALLDQLARRDVPALGKALGLYIPVAVAKGRQNYACPRDVNRARFIGGELATEAREVGRWLDRGGSGDWDDCPVETRHRAAMSTDSEGCDGMACPLSGPGCPADRARAALGQARVLVTSHAYLARTPPPLFPARVAIVDEAHALEASLRGSLSGTISAIRAGRLARRVLRALGREDDNKTIRAVELETEAILRLATGQLREGEDKAPLPPGWHPGSDPVGATRGLVDEIEAREEELEEMGAGAPRAERALVGRVAPAARRYAMHLRWALGQAGEGVAAWSERDREGKVAAQVAPVDTRALGASVLSRFPSAILCSATLAPGGSFDAALRDTGAGDEAATLDLPSPWPLRQMGLLVVPAGPLPADAAWPAWSARTAVEIVKATRGRALVLCSSSRNMLAIGAAMKSARLPFACRVQGEAGRSELREWFARETSGVLVATRSFFEGIDIAGESCSCVVIDRVPFGVPVDPLESAIARAMEARGEDPFLDRSVPGAASLLAQAAGRLIRSETDRGVLALLDGRVLQGGPAWSLARRALPPFPLSRDPLDAGRFLDGTWSPPAPGSILPTRPMAGDVLAMGKTITLSPRR